MSKPITDTLRMFRGGVFVSECSDRFAEVVKSVNETGKAGKLTITIDVKKVGPALGVLARVTDKTPEETPDFDMYWPTDEGDLALNNPKQRTLDLSGVEAPKGARELIDPESGEISNVG